MHFGNAFYGYIDSETGYIYDGAVRGQVIGVVNRLHNDVFNENAELKKVIEEAHELTEKYYQMCLKANLITIEKTPAEQEREEMKQTLKEAQETNRQLMQALTESNRLQHETMQALDSLKKTNEKRSNRKEPVLDEFVGSTP